MTDLPDQTALWERKHGQGEHEYLRHSPSHFAPIAEKYFPAGAVIAELGCGVGRESEYFARRGFKVLASDLSPAAITQDLEHFSGLDIEFSVHDMRQPLALSDGQVDVVYANLSLHYFDHVTTTKIFAEIWRILKPGGILAFTCKSIHDFHYGKGGQLEPDVFISEKGHVRHLFSIDYTKGLLAGKFQPLLLEEVRDENDGQVDSLIRCVAKRAEPADEELFDVVDEHDRPTGQKVDRQTAHAGAVLHRCVAVYVFDEHGDLFVQNHDSGLLDHSVGGHVSAGEDYLPSALREMEEEIGLKGIKLKPVITGLYSDEQFNPAAPLAQKTRQRHMFGVFECRAPAGWRFQPNQEVSGLSARPLKDVVADMNVNSSNFTPGFINTMAKYLELSKSPLRLDIKKCRESWGRS